MTQENQTPVPRTAGPAGPPKAEQEILREKLHYLLSCNPTGTGSCYPLTDKILALFATEIHTQAETWGYIPGPKGLRNPEMGERLEP